MQGPWDTGTWDDALWDALPVTGNSATGSPGDVGKSSTVAVTGNEGTGQAGTAQATTTVALSGNDATGQVGNVSHEREVALSGVVAIGYPGDETPTTTIAISGVQAAGEAGNVQVRPQPVLIDDNHDGKRIKRNIEQERKRNDARRQAVIEAYERVVEGRPEVAEQIVAPFVKVEVVAQIPQIDFEALFADLERVRQLLDAQQEIDDEEVLLLI